MDTNAPVATPAGQLGTAFQSNVADMNRYMRFIGMYCMIVGVLYCITIIGAIFGLPAFFMGRRLREAGGAFVRFSSSETLQDISEAVEKLKRSFYIGYVLLIVGLIFGVVYLVVIFGFVGASTFLGLYDV